MLLCYLGYKGSHIDHSSQYDQKSRLCDIVFLTFSKKSTNMFFDCVNNWSITIDFFEIEFKFNAAQFENNSFMKNDNAHVIFF